MQTVDCSKEIDLESKVVDCWGHDNVVFVEPSIIPVVLLNTMLIGIWIAMIFGIPYSQLILPYLKTYDVKRNKKIDEDEKTSRYDKEMLELELQKNIASLK
jgi:hypothetical protein